MEDSALYGKLLEMPGADRDMALLFAGQFSTVEFRRGQVLVSPGQELRAIYFIEKGLYRGYRVFEPGTLDWIEGHGAFLVSEGYFRKVAEQEYVEFMTDGRGFLLDHRKAEAFFGIYPGAVPILFWILEQKIAGLRRRERMLRITDLDERYLLALKENPMIMKTAPRETLARFLNISLRHFDRLKRTHLIG